MEYQDKEIVCVNKGKDQNCEGTFLFEAGEQHFYAEKGYTEPKRCASCRAKKKAESGFGGSDRRPAFDRGRGPKLPQGDESGYL